MIIILKCNENIDIAIQKSGESAKQRKKPFQKTILWREKKELEIIITKKRIQKCYAISDFL